MKAIQSLQATSAAQQILLTDLVSKKNPSSTRTGQTPDGSAKDDDICLNDSTLLYFSLVGEFAHL